MEVVGVCKAGLGGLAWARPGARAAVAAGLAGRALALRWATRLEGEFGLEAERRRRQALAARRLPAVTAGGR